MHLAEPPIYVAEIDKLTERWFIFLTIAKVLRD